MTGRTIFQQFVAHQPKRKRAGGVCVACHEKKVKCDFEELTTQGYRTCTNCAAAGNECRYRTSNRDRRSRISQRASTPRNPEPPAPTVPSRNERTMPPAAPLEGIHEYQNFLTTPPLSAEMNPNASEHVQEASEATSLDHGFHYVPNRDLYQYRKSPRSAIIGVSPSHSLRQPQEASSAQLNDSLSIQPRNDAADTYLGQTGFLELYGPETRLDADGQVQHRRRKPEALDFLPSELEQVFEETYFEFCHPWCPVLDRGSLPGELAQSPLLLNTLALAASHVQPPMIPCAGPAAYYDRAKQMFYGDKEENLIMCLKSIALMYWWSPRAPSRVHRDSSWWWTTVAIRHAQHGGFHREPKPGSLSRSNVDPGLRRRIWWTLFARERLTALCQDRPCVIDPEDCDVREPSLDDFPEKDDKAETFIQWVRLCTIIGRIAKHLSRPSHTSSSPFPVHLATELINWVQSLPENLTLGIRSQRTTKFNRDIYQLHLPYLAVIIVLHLSRSSQPLPKAYPAAILAASCVARIFKDCLARGTIRYMMAISCWYCGIALLALLQARQIEHFALAADQDIGIILIALNELRIMWPTANIFIQGFERLRSSSVSAAEAKNTSANAPEPAPNGQTSDLDEFNSNNGIDWTQYFPFASAQTSGLANTLLPEHQDDLVMDDAWFEFMTLDLSELFDAFEGGIDAMPALPVL